MICSRLTPRRLNFQIGILQAEYLMLRSNSSLDAHDIGLNDLRHRNTHNRQDGYR